MIRKKGYDDQIKTAVDRGQTTPTWGPGALSKTGMICTMEELLECKIHIVVMYDKTGSDKLVGETTMELSKFFPLVEGQEIKFEERISKDNTGIGTMDGSFSLYEIPMFAQMTRGTHNDDGTGCVYLYYSRYCECQVTVPQHAIAIRIRCTS